MADNRITKKRLKNHFAYSWWKYALAAVLSAMGVSLIFASTAYRPPADKQLTVYVLNDYVNTDALQADLWARIKESCPEQEELTVLNIDLTDDTNIYAPMQFSTYVAAQQGDLFLMPCSEMLKIASDGAEEAFVDLTEYIEGGVIDVGGLDLSAGEMDRADGTTGVFAIPAGQLYGLQTAYYNNPKDSVLCIPLYSQNQDTAAKGIQILMELGAGEKPAEEPEATAEPAAQPQVFR